MKKWLSRNLFLILALAFILGFNVASMRRLAPTADEGHHCLYGWNILGGNPDRVIGEEGFNPGVMPITALNAVPVRIAALLGSGREEYLLEEPTVAGRLVTLLFSLLLAVYVYTWSGKLYGKTAAGFSLILYAFSPNIIAHSRLITTDLYTAGAVTVSLYYFWKFLKFGGRKRAAASAVTLGLAQLTKYTCLFLYPIFFLLALVRYLAPAAALLRRGGFGPLFRKIGVFVLYSLLLAAVSVLIVNAGFLFDRTLIPLGDYDFSNPSFRALQSRLEALDRFPVPLPYPFVAGPDFYSSMDHQNAYLRGEARHPDGFISYFFWAFLYKVPLAAQALILLALVNCLVKRKIYNFREDELFLLLPAAVLFLAINFSQNMQFGFRKAIVVLPLLHIFCGSLFKDRRGLVFPVKALIGALLVYLIVSVLSYFPHYIPYLNELVWDRRQGYKVLADSNIQCGQDNWYLEEFLKDNPDVILFPRSPRPGRIVVGVNRLVGIHDREEYRWLRENFEPDGRIAYSWLLYDISPRALEEKLEGFRQPGEIE